MFTGIIQDVGSIQARVAKGRDLRLTIAVQSLDLKNTAEGDSICVQGVCLTALAITPRSFEADVSAETLSLTTLGSLEVGSPVNLEPALRAGDPLGGHLVSGHIDGMGEVIATSEDARSLRVSIAPPSALAKYITQKGSITIEGVSLTVNEVDGSGFGVNLIPHTREVTTLGRLAKGTRVNLEVDQIARYVERLLGSCASRG